MKSSNQQSTGRSLRVAGGIAILFALLMVSAELRTGLLERHAGWWARRLLIAVAVSLSVWGLKEILSLWWPKSVTRPTRARRRNRFMMPIEGMVYCVIMFVLLAGSVIGRSNTLMLVFALMAGPFILNGSITFMMLKHLSVGRAVPPRVMVGEPFSAELRLSNPKRWFSAWLMSVRDDISNGRESLHPEVLFARVPRRSHQQGQYQLRLSQRGRYTFGPVQVNSRFPLGLVERGLVLSVHDEILVFPAIGRLTSGWRRQMISVTQPASHARPRSGSYNDDFHRIREYRHGDDPRGIHWRTSARRNELMVREYRESRDRELILLLDLSLPVNASTVQRQRLEYAISFAATICHDQLLSGEDVSLSFAANAPPLQYWKGTAENGGRDKLLDLLALLEPNPRADLAALREFAHREQTPHSRTVLVTTVAGREKAIDWSQSDVIDKTNRGWVEPPQVILADPQELATLFSLEHLTTA